LNGVRPRLIYPLGGDAANNTLLTLLQLRHLLNRDELDIASLNLNGFRINQNSFNLRD